MIIMQRERERKYNKAYINCSRCIYTDDKQVIHQNLMSSTFAVYELIKTVKETLNKSY